MEKSEHALESADWLDNAIKDFIATSPENSLQDKTNERAWDEPLVGFSNGADPIYQGYKQNVGEFHWTPLEIFSEIYPDLDVSPEDLTIISWVLPQTLATKIDHRKETGYPSERWVRSRIFGEKTNEKLRLHVVETLKEAGYEALAPTLTPGWKTVPSEPFFLASKWSERHAAHAAGLGTFGLCDGLITPRGKAMRVGSVIARIEIEPTERPYTDHQAYCLFFSEGVCGNCIKRCPVDALSKKGHDKKKCLAFLREKTTEYVKTHFGFEGYGCGLCQTGVPCESKIPTLKDLE
ncbi:MAG: epoxyqueuosine reductase [Deltaproteobacteria bacterium]|nr:epoxyqueuosine reductase [Deltaproteobacteria bacterium]MBW2139905.1 epoxyqueuosine reductase [Deltaproteobacteria bacterium]MBW2323076.1 epoxyqueuosine reductase [Deltaproteobacteria bacterium]